MNIWVKKQMIFCKDSKKGVRAEILEVLSHQFKDGHTVLTWFPYDDTYYSDQPIWLVMGVTGYIKETGEYYSRVIHKDGVIGAPQSKGSTIYSNPQVWGIMGDLIILIFLSANICYNKRIYT